MTNRYTIRVDASSNATEEVEQVVRNIGGSDVVTRNPDDDFVQIDATLTAEQADEIGSNEHVLGVVEDHEAKAIGGDYGFAEEAAEFVDQAGDTLSGQETPYGIERVNAAQLHDQGVTGQDVPVSVADTGIDPSHEDLAVEGGRGHTRSENAPPSWAEDAEHGTHCSGTLAAEHNNVGVIGGAPDVELWADKVLGANGRGAYSTISAGITAAVKAGCKIVSCSIGGNNPSQALKDALAFARKRGAVVICATGNDGADQVSYPARYGLAVGVGASTRNDTIADFSNRGPGVDLVAPGKGIVSTVPGGYASGWQGTSMATPLISACVALLVGEGHKPRRAVEALKATARTIDAPEHAQGAGLADVAAAHEKLATDGGKEPSPWDPNLKIPWPPENNTNDDSEPTMKDLSIDGNGKDAGPAWYFFDVSGTVEKAARADKDERINQSPRNRNHVRASGRLLGGVDDFRYTGEIEYFHITGAWGGTTITVDGKECDPWEMPHFDERAPEETEDAFPDGLPDGGFEIGESTSIVEQIPGARNRDAYPHTTTDHIYLYLHPDGSDDAVGSKQEPLASVREACRRVPEMIHHDVQILAAPGRYVNPGPGGLTIGCRVQDYFTHTRKGFTIMGLGESKDDVVFDGYRQWNINFWSNGSWQDSAIENCTLNTTVTFDQGKGFGLNNVLVNPVREGSVDGKVAIGGYGPKAMLWNVEFGDRTRLALRCKEGGEFVLNGCSGQVKEAVVGGHSGTVYNAYGNSFTDANGDAISSDEWLPSDFNRNKPVVVYHGAREF